MRKIFHRRMVGDFVVSYDEMLDKESPVLIGTITCNKKALEKLYNGYPEHLDFNIELLTEKV